MDKSNVIGLLNECFNVEGKCAVVYLTDGSSFVINSKPKCFDLMMSFEMKIIYGEQCVTELINVPYRNILYITITTTENMQIISDYMENQGEGIEFDEEEFMNELM